MNPSSLGNLPPSLKYFLFSANIILTTFIIITGKFIISPLIAALIIAVLLRPLAAFLENFGLPRIISSVFCVLLFALCIISLLTYLTSQLHYILTDPSLSTAHFNEMFFRFHDMVLEWFGISIQDQFSDASTSGNVLRSVIGYLLTALTGAANYLTMILLFFLSLFFLVLYRSFFISFIFKLFDKEKHEKVASTLRRINIALNNYIVGLFNVMFIVATLNSLGLLLLGISHAVVFGIFGALLTIIPYIGILVGSLIPAAYAFMTTGSVWYLFGVIFVFGFVQFLEGNFITPILIGYKENINPFIAILGLFIGGMLLGTVGLVLAIPILGIIKIICDEFVSSRPIGYVMGHPEISTNETKIGYSIVTKIKKKIILRKK